MVNKREVTQAEFARLAGVSRAAIQKASRGALAAAMTAHGVDAAHPAARAYIAAQAPRVDMADGIDALYNEALAYCRELGRVSVRALEAHFKIPRSRCQRLAAVIQAAGVEIAAPPQPTNPDAARVAEPIPEPAKIRAKPTPKARVVVPPYTPPQAQIPPADFDHGLKSDPNDDIEPPDEIQTLAELTLRELVDRYGTASRFEKWLSAVQKIEAIAEKRLSNAETKGELISKKLVKSAVLDVIDGVFTRLLTDGCKTVATRAHALALAGGSVAEVRDVIEDTMQSFIKPAKRQMAAKALA